MKKLKQKIRKANSKVDPAISDTDPFLLACRPPKVSDIYKTFQGVSKKDVQPQHVLSIEAEDDDDKNEAGKEVSKGTRNFLLRLGRSLSI